MSSARPVYTRRIIDSELDEFLGALAALSLDGPKGVGKTETALQRAISVVRLDRPDERAVLTADLDAVGHLPTPVLLDEWQLLPEIWDVVRRLVDGGAEAGSFLLTGSATPVARIHSGAGRIVPLRMRPMSLAERQLETPTVSFAELMRGNSRVGGASDFHVEDYVDEILRSGFPGIRAQESERVVRGMLDGYIQRLVDHEVFESGALVRRPAALREWLTAYAAATATTATYETIRDAVSGGGASKPTRDTAGTYRDVLQRLWILDPVGPWLPGQNHLKRLGRSPKHNLTDPALAARLLGLSKATLLGRSAGGFTRPGDARMLGQLFESLVIQSVEVYAQAAEARIGHLRTSDGAHEVDLIVTGEANRVLALEVKLTATPSDADVRHLHWLKRELGDDLIDAAVITAGGSAYRRADSIAVIPAMLLGP